MFCWTFSIVNRLYQYSSNGYSPDWLVITASSTGALQGFLNSIIYGSNKVVRTSWKEDATTLRDSMVSARHMSLNRRKSSVISTNNPSLNPVIEIEMPVSGDFDRYPSEGDAVMGSLY